MRREGDEVSGYRFSRMVAVHVMPPTELPTSIDGDLGTAHICFLVGSTAHPLRMLQKRSTEAQDVFELLLPANMVLRRTISYSSHPLIYRFAFCGFGYHGQPPSKNIEWKIPGISNSDVLSCMLF